MYKIDNLSNVYYVINLEKNTINKIGDEKDLIQYLSRWYTRPYMSYKKVFDISDLNLTGKDLCLHTVGTFPYYDTVYCLRKLMIVDGYNRVVDISRYKKEVENIWANEKSRSNVKTSCELEYGDWLEIKNWRNVTHRYRYRIDPVPFIHNYNNGPYQHKKYKHILKMVLDPEYKEYNRISHYYSVLDGVYYWEPFNVRSVSKSWKDNKKIKKQWQKNLK